jgi:uncharacterized protein
VSNRRPLQIPVTELLRQPGTRRVLQREVPLDTVSVAGVSVPTDAEVALDLVLEATGDDIIVSGSLSIPWRGECRRCLGEVRDTSTATVREVYQHRAVEGDTYPMGDGIVDLEPMLRDAVLLALPLAPLCAEACAGPDPERFPAAATDDTSPAGGHDAEAEVPRDPRWAALDALRFDAGGDDG